ncbi:MAG: hypothetical protein WC472_04385 [Candidatus Paceibacterota bacterium]
MIKKFLKRFIGRQCYWSIGIYTGDSPYHLIPPKDIQNPVLTAKDVTDRKALFVADPFMVREKDVWYMFFEVLNRETGKGEIGLAISKDGRHWTYQQIVLTESFHLAYPYVFKWQGAFYMIPDSSKKKAIRLYKAVLFPCHWEFVGNLLTGFNFVDSSIFNYHDRWWLFTCPTNKNDVLKLFYASNLGGPWLEHPASPIIDGNAHIARCGGRVMVLGNRIIRYAQDDYPAYGSCLRAFEITKLTNKEYEEKGYPNNPVLKANWRRWNRSGMHNIDAHCLGKNEWIACVDGYCRVVELKNRIV